MTIPLVKKPAMPLEEQLKELKKNFNSDLRQINLHNLIDKCQKYLKWESNSFWSFQMGLQIVILDGSADAIQNRSFFYNKLIDLLKIPLEVLVEFGVSAGLDAYEENACVVCGKMGPEGGETLKKCGGCFRTKRFYCSKEHQAAHWKSVHKYTCEKVHSKKGEK